MAAPTRLHRAPDVRDDVHDRAARRAAHAQVAAPRGRLHLDVQAVGRTRVAAAQAARHPLDDRRIGDALDRLRGTRRGGGTRVDCSRRRAGGVPRGGCNACCLVQRGAAQLSVRALCALRIDAAPCAPGRSRRDEMRRPRHSLQEPPAARAQRAPAAARPTLAFRPPSVRDRPQRWPCYTFNATDESEFCIARCEHARTWVGDARRPPVAAPRACACDRPAPRPRGYTMGCCGNFTAIPSAIACGRRAWASSSTQGRGCAPQTFPHAQHRLDGGEGMGRPRVRCWSCAVLRHRQASGGAGKRLVAARVRRRGGSKHCVCGPAEAGQAPARAARQSLWGAGTGAVAGGQPAAQAVRTGARWPCNRWG